MTKVLCEMTGCKYNNSCCLSSAKNGYCTKEAISFRVDQEMCQLECEMFEEDLGTKEVECQACQIQKYGGIRLPRKLNFEQQSIENFKF